MKVSNLTIELDDIQINRCYDVFIFEEDEHILSAWVTQDNRLHIKYVETKINGKDVYPDELVATIYEPDLSDEEGQEKLNYILFGKERH